MLTIAKTSELRQYIVALKRQGVRVGFVPTMGYLHEGHLSLVRLAKGCSDKVIVSIFVNPTQFNDPQDYAKYPIDLPRDSRLLEQEQVDLLYTPSRESLYGSDFQSWVEVAELCREHEGAARPGHFRGVSTVVAMLFNLVQPDVAVFGEKDFQQLRIIEQMVEDLKFPLEIVRGPTVREADGLAMSSRNVRLSKAARPAALLLSQGLFSARTSFAAGQKNAARLCATVQDFLERSSLINPEYVRVVDEQDLKTLELVKDRARLILAAFVDGVRLIDNIELGARA